MTEILICLVVIGVVAVLKSLSLVAVCAYPAVFGALTGGTVAYLRFRIGKRDWVTWVNAIVASINAVLVVIFSILR